VPYALSSDLRSRLVSACQSGELPQTEIAELFQVHLKTVEKLWRQWRTTGTVEAKPHGGGVKARLADWQEELHQLVAEQSDRTLEDFVALMWERYRVLTSVPVLSRTLQRLGLPRKKGALGHRAPPTADRTGSGAFPRKTEQTPSQRSGVCR
jgi:transposase